MNRVFVAVGLLLFSALIAQVAPAAEQTLRYRLSPGEQLTWKLELDQVVRTHPMDMPDQVQVLEREIRTDVRSKVVRAAGALVGLRIRLKGFKLESRLGENDIAPIGADKMSDLELVQELDELGPAALIGLGNQDDLDASNWPSMQPLAEPVQSSLQLGLPILSEDTVTPGDTWIVARDILLAAPNATSLRMEVLSVYLYAGLVPCGGSTCARIEEVTTAWQGDFEPLGASLVRVDVSGGGTATHLFDVGRGKPVSTKGRLVLYVQLATQTVPGLPAYATFSTMQVDYRLVP